MPFADHSIAFFQCVLTSNPKWKPFSFIVDDSFAKIWAIGGVDLLIYFFLHLIILNFIEQLNIAHPHSFIDGFLLFNFLHLALVLLLDKKLNKYVCNTKREIERSNSLGKIIHFSLSNKDVMNEFLKLRKLISSTISKINEICD